jgi:hypothetical protein
VRLPSTFVLGAQSPMPPRYGKVSAALMTGARCQIGKDCGHFVWMERPGFETSSQAVRRAAPRPGGFSSCISMQHTEQIKELSTSTIQLPRSSSVTESLRRPHREQPLSFLGSRSAMQSMVPAPVCANGGWCKPAP